MSPTCKFSYKFMWNYEFKLGHGFFCIFFLGWTELWSHGKRNPWLKPIVDATFKPYRQMWRDLACRLGFKKKWEDGRAQWLGEMLTLGKYYCWCHWVVLSALQTVQKRIPSRGGRKIIWQSDHCNVFCFCFLDMLWSGWLPCIHFSVSVEFGMFSGNGWTSVWYYLVLFPKVAP